MDENSLLLKSLPKKIIKRKDQRVDSIFFGKILKHQVLKAEEKAAEILQKAHEKADEAVEKATAEAENIRREAYKTGREAAAQELLENILAAREQRSQALHEIEGEVLKLAIKIAEKIIGREVETDETVRGEIVLTALRQARQQEMLTVRVNAADLPLVEKMRGKIDSFGRAQYLDFIADQSVGAGGCLIESASGTIDARLETQLRVLEKAMLAQVGSE